MCTHKHSSHLFLNSWCFSLKLVHHYNITITVLNKHHEYPLRFRPQPSQAHIPTTLHIMTEQWLRSMFSLPLFFFISCILGELNFRGWHSSGDNIYIFSREYIFTILFMMSSAHAVDRKYWYQLSYDHCSKTGAEPLGCCNGCQHHVRNWKAVGKKPKECLAGKQAECFLS